MFQRETKLWQDKKELVNEMCKFEQKSIKAGKISKEKKRANVKNVIVQ